MRVLDIKGIPTSLGEIINIKHHLDLIKNQYDKISLSFHTNLWSGSLFVEASDWPQKEVLWRKYLGDIGKLFFSEHPYVLEPNSPVYGGDVGVLTERLGITPQKSEMGHLLCAGTPLDIGEYIVITTKVRELDRNVYAPLSIQLYSALKELSKKYKIVVLGERKVEMRKEYGNHTNLVYGLYEEIVCNVPSDRIVDLTVPALGETVSDLSKIMQDCLIMRDAKFAITAGCGGNFCLTSSCAKMHIGFRHDKIVFTDRIFENREYANAIVTKDWNRFISAIRSYI